MDIGRAIRFGVRTAMNVGFEKLEQPLTLNHDANLSGSYSMTTRSVIRSDSPVVVSCVAATISQEDVDNGYAPDRSGRKFLVERAALERACAAASVPVFVPEVEKTRGSHAGSAYTFSKVRIIPSGTLYILYGRVT